MGWIFHISSPLVAEGLAIRLVLSHALTLGFNSLHVESDSQQVINAINFETQLPEIYGILQDISLFFFIAFFFNFSKRQYYGRFDSKTVPEDIGGLRCVRPDFYLKSYFEPKKKRLLLSSSLYLFLPN